MTKAAGPSGGITVCGYPDGTIPLVTGSKNHLTLYGNRTKPNKDKGLTVATMTTGLTRGFQR